MRRQALAGDPLSGTLFVFCSHRRHALKCLIYDGQGFWLCQKRLSSGRFTSWPKAGTGAALRLSAPQLHLLLWNGDPAQAHIAPLWRPVELAAER